MRRLRNAISLSLALFVLAAVGPGNAGAEMSRYESSGQPIISGILGGHGVLHCQPLAGIAGGPTAPGSAPGVIVANPQGRHLGAPRGGWCNEIAEELYGEL